MTRTSLLSLIACLICTSLSLQSQNLLTEQAKLNYGYWDMAKMSNYLVGSRYGAQKLDIYDVSDPQNALLVDTKTLTSASSVVCIYNNRYALLGGYQKLTIMDLQNVSNPVVVSQLSVAGDIVGINCVDGLAFLSLNVGTNDYRLQRVNLSTIGLPMTTTASNFTNAIGELCIENGFAFLLEKKQNSAVLHAYTMTAQGTLGIAGNTTLPTAMSLDVKDNKAYISTASKMLVYDISMPTSITQLQQITISNPSSMVALDATHFATTNNTSIKLTDINNTTASTSFSSNSLPISLFSSNNMLYYSTVGGTYLLDTPTAATEIESSDFSNELTVYPNPSIDTWHIKSKNVIKGKLTIWDYSGMILFEKEIDYANEIEIENTFSAGMYLYTLDTEDGKYATGWLVSAK